MAPFDPDLLDALESSEVEVVSGTVWRQVLLPTSVTRSNLRGARWNPPGIEALYCSLDPATAAAEIDHLISKNPIPITRTRVTYALDVRVSRVADLRPHAWSTPFGHPYDPTKSDECQVIGGAAAWLGCGALLAPSQRHSGDNLVIFVANLDLDDSVDPQEPGFDHPPGPPPSASWSALAPLT
jgi:RES domain-containing protein